jgi:hypothetical protein
LDEAGKKLIADFQTKIQGHLDEIFKLKSTINHIAELQGEGAIYTDLEQQTAGIGPHRSDAYYGKKLATAIREYLEFRRQAVPVEEILKGLEQGGFDFNALNWTEGVRLRALAINIGKNTAVFHRLPNGMWGLKTWYPEAKEKEDRKAPTKRAVKSKPQARKSGKLLTQKQAAKKKTAEKVKQPLIESPAHKAVYGVLADGETHSRKEILEAGKKANVVPISILGLLKHAKDVEKIGSEGYKLRSATSNVHDFKKEAAAE